MWDKVELENGIIGYVFSSYLLEYIETTVNIETIELSIDSNIIEKGETATLNIEIYPSNANTSDIEYISSNENIAVVDNEGNILGISSGTFTITARYKENYNIYDTIEITINSKVTSLILNASEIYLEIGDTFQIESIILPEDASNKNVRYENYDESILEIDTLGLITVLKQGNTTISVVTEDGNISEEIEVIVTRELNDDELNFSESLTINNYYISGFNYQELEVSSIKQLINTNYLIEIYDTNNNLLSDNDKVGTGSTIKIIEIDNDNINDLEEIEKNILMTYKIIIYGDVNGDGGINSIDLLVLQRHILQIELLEAEFLVSGNINKNGNNPSSIDSLLIQRHILELQIISQ